MRTFDLASIAELHEIFPELTPAQFETAILFCLGLSQGEIAHLRSVSYPAVRDTLQRQFPNEMQQSKSLVIHTRVSHQ